MDYLHEIAQVILPSVRRAALGDGKSSEVMRELADRCEQLVLAREGVIRAEREATRRAPRAEGAATPAVPADSMRPAGPDIEQGAALDEAATPPSDTAALDVTPPDEQGDAPARAPKAWLIAPHTRALEFLADALAEKPERIPAAMKEAPTGFYPAFLKYLLHTVAEAAQPRFRPRTLLDRLWWWLWTWFAANEYAAQLRDRHERVARELAKTRAWQAVDPAKPSGDGNAAGGDAIASGDEKPPGTFTASVFGTGNFGGSVKTAVGDVIESVCAAVGMRSNDEAWQRVAAVLGGSSPIRQQFLDELGRDLLESPDLVRRLAEVAGAAVPFTFAFDIELLEIRASRAIRNGGDPDPGIARSAPRAAAELKLFGVALSGGGIRSATFNLGVLQGLAGFQLLRARGLSLDCLGGRLCRRLARVVDQANAPPEGRDVACRWSRIACAPSRSADPRTTTCARCDFSGNTAIT